MRKLRPVVLLLLWSCVCGCFTAGSAISAEYSMLNFMPSILAGSHSQPKTEWKTHADIDRWLGADTCLRCHADEARQVFSSVHYQWRGETPDVEGGPNIQGKLDVGVNSYCINITGNWNGCGSCHVGLGGRPEPAVSSSQLRNIDCLICHQQEYKRKKIDGRFYPDTEAMDISIVEAAKTVHMPTRATCLQCHAKGGGGDNYKRGDMAMAHISTSDRNFDVHMSTNGGDLSCQSCHHTEDHLMAGRGSDLRPTDLDRDMQCTDCHRDKDSLTGHHDRSIGKHVARVACQSCHIGRYARNASDTSSSEQTETHRTWLAPHPTPSGAIHPTPTMSGNLIPKYRWWNGKSTTYLLFDDAAVDLKTGKIPTARPQGSVNDSSSKLYPFKYKTALQPLATDTNQLIALDTSVYFATGNAYDAVISGLQNMGYSASSPFDWAQTDTFQLITHEVEPASRALSCSDCHDNTQRMDLQGDLGYQLKGPRSSVCVQCHEWEEPEHEGYEWIHEEHVDEEGYDCSRCHTFSRPER